MDVLQTIDYKPFMALFDWLKIEVATVKTHKFYVMTGPLPPDKRLAVEGIGIQWPPSYREFVKSFGNFDLYRKGSIYLVRVFSEPRPETFKGNHLLCFGRTDFALAYFKVSLMALETETPIFEWRHSQGIRKVADGFEEWLEKKCDAARKRFTKKEWETIRIGPPPFEELERAIVAARRHFQWRVVGINREGEFLFEVHNNSGITLPFLSLGVRKANGEPVGGIWLPVLSILPGQIKVIPKVCYKERYRPEEIEVFSQPDPEPEDREQYWEFRGLK